MIKTAVRVGLLIGLTLAWMPVAGAASRVEDFYGVWVYENQSPYACSDVDGEGPWVGIGPKYYFFETIEPCQDVEMFLVDGKLRLSASCEGDENGYSAIVREYELSAGDKLKHEDQTFMRCTGPLPKWYGKD